MKKSDESGGDRPEKEAWARFERAVDAAVKSGPKHKETPQSVNKKERPASKGRVHKGKTGA
jgi:hypothetical protein